LIGATRVPGEAFVAPLRPKKKPPTDDRSRGFGRRGLLFRGHERRVPRAVPRRFYLLAMLSDDRKRAIQSEAVSRARALNDELLRHETRRLTFEENDDAPPGDRREELHIRCLGIRVRDGRA
jgi:hypothetical protein